MLTDCQASAERSTLFYLTLRTKSEPNALVSVHGGWGRWDRKAQKCTQGHQRKARRAVRHATCGLTKEQEKEDPGGGGERAARGEEQGERGGWWQEVARAEEGKEGRGKGGGRNMEGRRKEHEDAAVRKDRGPAPWSGRAPPRILRPRFPLSLLSWGRGGPLGIHDRELAARVKAGPGSSSESSSIPFSSWV